jgi:hypothetical protein
VRVLCSHISSRHPPAPFPLALSQQKLTVSWPQGMIHQARVIRRTRSERNEHDGAPVGIKTGCPSQGLVAVIEFEDIRNRHQLGPSGLLYLNPPIIFKTPSIGSTPRFLPPRTWRKMHEANLATPPPDANLATPRRRVPEITLRAPSLRSSSLGLKSSRKRQIQILSPHSIPRSPRILSRSLGLESHSTRNLKILHDLNPFLLLPAYRWTTHQRFSRSFGR